MQASNDFDPLEPDVHVAPGPDPELEPYVPEAPVQTDFFQNLHDGFRPLVESLKPLTRPSTLFRRGGIFTVLSRIVRELVRTTGWAIGFVFRSLFQNYKWILLGSLSGAVLKHLYELVVSNRPDSVYY